MEDGTKVRRIYSPIQWVDPFEGDHEGRAGEFQLPLILYSKQAIRDRLAWLRSSGVASWEVPTDVSDDYQRHMQAEEQQDAPRVRDSGAFFPEVAITFAVKPGEHYHVPLLLNPFGYSVYRGS